jgi:transposase-like protein
MQCLLCDYPKAHKHGKTAKGNQRYFCPVCKRSFTANRNEPSYRRRVSAEQVQTVLRFYSEGNSLRGISRLSGLAYNTVKRIVSAATPQTPLVVPPVAATTPETMEDALQFAKK